MASVQEQATDLLNQAKVATKDDKQYLLAQVKELCLHRDPSLLPEVVPELCEFQLDPNAATRRALLTLLRDIVKDYPEYCPHLVRVLSYVLEGEAESVKKACVITANNIFRPAVLSLARRPATPDAERDWRELVALKERILALAASPLAEVSSVVLRFMGTLVLAFTRGPGLPQPGKSSTAPPVDAADASVLGALPDRHPFLRAVHLEFEGRAVLQRMVKWLREGGPPGASFGSRHYIVLENALQAAVSARAHLFEEVVPAMAEALRRAAAAPGSGVAGQLYAVAPPGLRETASSLRGACVKLLRAAPGPSAAAAALADAVEASGSDNQARTAIAANPRLQGRLAPSASGSAAAAEAQLQLQQQQQQFAEAAAGGLFGGRGADGGYSYPTSETDAAALEAAVGAVLEGSTRLPPPPPGHRSQQNTMLLQPLLGQELFDYVVAQLRPDEDFAKLFSRTAEEEEAANAVASVAQGQGQKRATEGLIGAEDPAAKRSKLEGEGLDWLSVLGGASGAAAAEPQAAAAVPAVAPSPPPAPAPAPPKEDPAAVAAAAAAAAALQAFRRIVKSESGAALEGQMDVYRKVVAKLARVLAEGCGSSGSAESGVLEEVVARLTADYGRRFPAAMSVLYELYVAELVGAPMSLSSSNSSSGGSSCGGASETTTKDTIEGTLDKVVKDFRPPPRMTVAGDRRLSGPGAFKLYDTTLLALLRGLTAAQVPSNAAPRRARSGVLLTKTVLAAPRLPSQALDLLFRHCEFSGNDAEAVKAGLATLKGLLLERPTVREPCLEAILRFALRPEAELQRTAVQLSINILWPMPQFEAAVEGFADETLRSSLQPEGRAGAGVSSSSSSSSSAGGVVGSVAAAMTKKLARQDSGPDYEPMDEDERAADSIVGTDDGGAASAPVGAEAAAARAEAAAEATRASMRARLAYLWPLPPASSEEAARRLALYFALCTRSSQKLKNLFDAYARAGEPVRQAIEGKLGEYGAAAAARLGGPALLALAGSCPAASDSLVHRLLEMLVPRQPVGATRGAAGANLATPELVAATRKLRDARVAVYAAEAAAAAAVKTEAGAGKPLAVPAVAKDNGVRYLVPVFAGLGTAAVAELLPQLLNPTPRDKEFKVAREAFLRLVPPPALVAAGATAPMTAAELLLLLHSFDFAKAGLSVKKVADAIVLALSIPHINTTQALRDALHAMIKNAEVAASTAAAPAAAGKAGKGATITPAAAPAATPLAYLSPLFMVTTILAADQVPLRNFIAATVLPKLVKWEVWKDKRLWEGFIVCSKKLAVESGATSFIALAQLPVAPLAELVKKLPAIGTGLARYASNLVAVPAPLRQVLKLP